MATCEDDAFLYETTFQNVSWSDIMDAEESEDPMAMERLKESARKKAEPQEERPIAIHDYRKPNPPSDISLTPPLSRRPLCPIVLTGSPRGKGSPKKDQSVFFQDAENDYPFLNPFTIAASTPACGRNTAQTISYAEAVRPRSKRGVGARECMSPLDMPTKKPLFYGSPDQCLQTELGASLAETTPGFVERNQKVVQRRLAFASHDSGGASTEMHSPTKKKRVETDPHRLVQRQKQIDFGKNTVGYENYIKAVPKFNRMKEHPRTPDKMQGCSKRSWDGQVRKWRRMLHSWDPPATTTDGTAVSAEEALLAGIDLDGDMEI